MNDADILEELEGRWNRDGEVPLHEFMAEFGIASSDADDLAGRAELVLELVQIDLERRWMSKGQLQVPTVPQILAEYPRLKQIRFEHCLRDADSKLRFRFAGHSSLSRRADSLSDSLADTQVERFDGASTEEHFAAHSRIDDYRIVRKLGEGGMGVVYEAIHDRLQKTVAIKVVRHRLVGASSAVPRFRREMRALARIDHPGIVRILDAGEFEGRQYLVTEFVQGRTLQQIVNTSGPFPVRQACEILLKASESLAVAHAAGIIHRDVKPSNFIETQQGELKLLDLGLALVESDAIGSTVNMSQTPHVLGTPDYMAPEQWDNAHQVDERADLYSLGCVLCFLLTGRAPYDNAQHTTELDKFKAHISGVIPNLKSTCPAAPDELLRVFERLMAKNLNERFANAEQVRVALTRVLSGFIESDAADTSPPVPTAKAASGQAALGHLSGSTWSRTVNWMAFGFVLVLVALSLRYLLSR